MALKIYNKDLHLHLHLAVSVQLKLLYCEIIYSSTVKFCIVTHTYSEMLYNLL